MSYSISVPANPDDPDQPGVGERVDLAVSEYLANTEVPIHTEESVYAAARVAVDLATSGAVGDPQRLSVTLVGHANPNHEPVAGWTRDVIQVNVNQTW